MRSTVIYTKQRESGLNYLNAYAHGDYLEKQVVRIHETVFCTAFLKNLFFLSTFNV